MFGATWDPLKNIYWKQNYSCAIDDKNLYHKHIECTGKVRKWGRGCNYQFSLCQKIEYHWEKQEESGCQLPGEDDLTSQLPLSVILSSQWCMDVIWHQTPSRTSQYYHAEECYSETMGDCDPRYGMTKLHEGGGRKGMGLKRGGWVFFIQYYKVSSPVVALEWLNIAKKKYIYIYRCKRWENFI